jgi:hypothetical protein
MAVVEHGQRAAGWGKNSFDSHCGHTFEVDGQRKCVSRNPERKFPWSVVPLKLVVVSALDHFGAHARLRATRNGGPALRKYFRQG